MLKKTAPSLKSAEGSSSCDVNQKTKARAASLVYGYSQEQ